MTASAAGLFAAAAIYLAFEPPRHLPPGRIVVAIGLAAMAFTLRLEIRVRQHRWVFAWGDTALVLSLILVSPTVAILATTLGKTAGAATTFLRRQPLRVLKLTYAASTHVLAATAATVAAVVIGRTPFTIADRRDLAALLAAGIIYDVGCNILTAAVIATADGTSRRNVWRAGLGLQRLTMVGNLTATLGALALAELDQRFILVLPLAAILLQQAYQGVRDARREHLAGAELAGAIIAIGQRHEDDVLTEAAVNAAALLNADGAHVLLQQQCDRPSVAPRPGQPDHLAPAGQWYSRSVAILDPDSDQPMGQLEVHFAHPPRITQRDLGILNALAAATRNSIAAARADAAARRLAAQLQHQITHHPVTGLLLREPLLAHIAERLRDIDATGHPVGLILVGLSDLEPVARALGHQPGNDLFRHIADCLRDAATDDEVIGHVGDDHLAIFAAGIAHLAELRPRADALVAAISTPLAIGTGIVSVNATAGIAYTASPISADELLRQAGAAQTLARRTNTTIDYYRPADDTTSGPSALLLAAELDDALRTGQLILRYQPFIDLTTARPVGVEAIVSWLHPTRGLRSGHDFHSYLPATLLTTYLDWLLQQALADRASWHDIDAGLPVSINLGGLNLLDRDLPTRLTTAVRTAGLKPHHLMLETPACATLNARISTIDDVLDDLRSIGVRVAADDFGAENSAMNRVLQAPITDLKIAGRIIEQAPTSPQARAILRATREIADSADLRIIATGAQTSRQLQAAYDAGISIAQGDALCRPLLAHRVHQELLERTANADQTPRAQIIRLHPDTPDDAG